MKRRHLFEIHDQSWCPQGVRDALTDYLQAMIHALDLYAPIAPLLQRVLRQTEAEQVVDLCSGGGGPWRRMRRALSLSETPTKVVLTDLFPNYDAWEQLEKETEGQVAGWREPVDATQVPPQLKGMRTFFSSVHHFSPEQVEAILRSAISQEQPIGLFDAAIKHPRPFLGNLASPLFALAVAWGLRPLSLSRMFWTYLCPVAPVVFCVDGCLSIMRSYCEEDFHEIIEPLRDLAPHYQWEIGTTPEGLLQTPILYLLAYPDREA